jgi:hypothetical protein
MSEIKDPGLYLIENHYKVLSSISHQVGIGVQEILPKSIEDFKGNYPDTVQHMRFQNYERRRKEKIEIISNKIQEVHNKNLSSKRSSSKSTGSRRKILDTSYSNKREPVFERVKKVREKEMYNLVQFIKEKVDGLTAKNTRSQRNLKKIYQLRDKQLQAQCNVREKRLEKMKIHRDNEIRVSRSFISKVEPITRPKLSKSMSLTKNLHNESSNIVETLEKITNKLNQSSIRAEKAKKYISLSASRLLYSYQPKKILDSEKQYRQKLEKIIEKHSKTISCKTQLSEKLIKKIRSINRKKAQKSEDFQKKNEKLEQMLEIYSSQKIGELNQRLENFKKNRALSLLISAEKWKIKKENQLENLQKNKKIIFRHKEKILTKVTEPHSSSEGSIKVQVQELSPLKAWRDNQLYKLRSKLILSK